MTQPRRITIEASEEDVRRLRVIAAQELWQVKGNTGIDFVHDLASRIEAALRDTPATSSD